MALKKEFSDKLKRIVKDSLDAGIKTRRLIRALAPLLSRARVEQLIEEAKKLASTPEEDNQLKQQADADKRARRVRRGLPAEAPEAETEE